MLRRSLEAPGRRRSLRAAPASTRPPGPRSSPWRSGSGWPGGSPVRTPACRPTGDRAVTGASVTRGSGPAKLTLSLRVTGIRADGYHLLDSEMVTLDLADTLRRGRATGDRARRSAPTGRVRRPGGATRRSRPTRTTWWPGPWPRSAAPPRCSWSSGSRPVPGSGAGRPMPPPSCGGPAARTRTWPPGSGPTCPSVSTGGRARVTGIGERSSPCPSRTGRFVLLLLPFGVDTAAVYRAWDELARRAAGCRSRGGRQRSRGSGARGRAPARGWRRVLEEATGRPAHLAGSGSTWFVEGSPEELGIAGRDRARAAGERSLAGRGEDDPAGG